MEQMVQYSKGSLKYEVEHCFAPFLRVRRRFYRVRGHPGSLVTVTMEAVSRQVRKVIFLPFDTLG
jgi:hypothetical protein